MPITVTHTKVSAIADDPAADAAGEVLPSDWNDNHQVVAALPVQEISLAEIRAVAAQYQQQARVLQMFRQRDWAEMVALYEAPMRQQDEDDIEMLLLTC